MQTQDGAPQLAPPAFFLERRSAEVSCSGCAHACATCPRGADFGCLSRQDDTGQDGSAKRGRAAGCGLMWDCGISNHTHDTTYHTRKAR